MSRGPTSLLLQLLGKTCPPFAHPITNEAPPQPLPLPHFGSLSSPSSRFKHATLFKSITGQEIKKKKWKYPSGPKSQTKARARPEQDLQQPKHDEHGRRKKPGFAGLVPRGGCIYCVEAVLSKVGLCLRFLCYTGTTITVLLSSFHD